MENYCEYVHDYCDYVIVCKNYSGMCAKDLLGKDYFGKPNYLPKDILARIKRYKEIEKQENK